MNIAIMGATSHIAKGLIDNFLQKSENHLYLFSRSAGAVQGFLDAIGAGDGEGYTIFDNYQNFASILYDVIINCIGVETRNKHNCDFTRYFSVTEEFDGLVIRYLQNSNPDALYISFSSGAVYGKGFSAPADEFTKNRIQVNNIVPEDYYGIARINAEAKHRAHSDLRIVDLRIFSYFSRYINISDGYFITDIMEAILGNTVLVTDTTNIVRDYLHPEDLFAMIVNCISAGRINLAIDVNSSSPVAKQDILDYFASEYGLKYESRPSTKNTSATGAKNNYFSVNKMAHLMGYLPKFGSMETLIHEAKYILNSN